MGTGHNAGLSVFFCINQSKPRIWHLAEQRFTFPVVERPIKIWHGVCALLLLQGVAEIKSKDWTEIILNCTIWAKKNEFANIFCLSSLYTCIYIAVFIIGDIHRQMFLFFLLQTEPGKLFPQVPSLHAELISFILSIQTQIPPSF